MKKSTLTILTLLPFVAIVFMMIYYFSFIFSVIGTNNEFAILDRMTGYIWINMSLGMLLMFLQVFLLSYYIMLLNRNDAITTNGRVLWIVLMFIFNTIPMIVYLFKHVYRQSDETVQIEFRTSDGNKKLILGILTFLPMVIFLIAAGLMTGAMSSMFTDIMSSTAVTEDAVVMNMFGVMMQMMMIQMVGFLFIIGLMIYYIVDIVKKKDMPDGLKIVWSIMFVFFNIQAMLVYWVVYVLVEQPMTPIIESQEVTS